ncbi:MAG TPA: hypothetical protein VH280_09935 [Verrucomicrobiae bacterium]|nr:hypothetical protein [Verrucomicrobiae bacterium]
MKLSNLIAPVIVAGIFIFTVIPSTTFGQGTTAFTYQGHLLDNGAEVNGTNGMIFTLYSAVTGGSVVGTPITNSVAVSNGLFTADLDYGASAFNGSARWLDIAVSNGTTNVELTPRTPVLPTPYATYAATAGTAATATTAGTATNFAGGTATFSGNGSGLTNVAANLQMTVFSTPGTTTFKVPTNVFSVIVEAWGGGGPGGTGNSFYAMGGGGGGAGGFIKAVVSVTPNASYQVIVGAGSTVAGQAGGTSSFGSTLVSATGGGAGQSPSSTTTSPAGGAGGHGSGAGTAATMLTITGGIGKYGSSDGGGDGGNAGAGGSGGFGNLGTAGTAGIAPGGGGGGGNISGTAGYVGGNGEVIVYY